MSAFSQGGQSVLGGGRNRRPRFAEPIMDDIDALEIDEDDVSVHSQASKRMKGIVSAPLIPEGWIALHNANGTTEKTTSLAAKPFMAASSPQRTFMVPQQTLQSPAQTPSPARHVIPECSRLQMPHPGSPLPPHSAPPMDFGWEQLPSMSARPQLYQPPPFYSQITTAGGQWGPSTHQGG